MISARDDARERAGEALEYALATSGHLTEHSDWIDYILEKVEDIYWEAAYVEGRVEGREDGYQEGRLMAQAGELS